ncbi:hypothetical protein [Hansschlegelia beijingensis]|uniref:Uncharacterized protein n=1 Tax=Hansschlegelia beijingensis TaxID=1133344 RepID=A0A7W6D846_9HYPH|nr:hypothetical protein [Hansschlegelia beijingensis]MBB3973994.1 hypothetical protein [Hansschlegelia beijingensis]
MPSNDGEPGEVPKPPARESALERKLWIATYVIIMVVLAAGAARRLMALL